MKVLIINEKLLEGGAEVYVQNLRKILMKDNEVHLLCFDDEFENKINFIDDKTNIMNIMPRRGISAAYNKMFFNLLLYKKIRKTIKKINPDKIILNHIVYNPKTQMKALKGYDVYQIIHDYSAVCPKSTCVREDFKVCTGYKCNNCMKKCKYHNSKISLLLKLLLTKKMERLRKKYVKITISPSQLLEEYLENFGYNSICINNPIEIQSTEKEIIFHDDSKRYIYVGAVNDNKGIFKFIEYFKDFSKKKNVELYILGSVYTECQNKMNDILNNYSNIKYLGAKRHEDVLAEIEKSDFIVVPSLWIENYPTTVLEGMLAKTVVIASDRGGMREMLADGRGLIFNIMDKNDVNKILNKTYSMTKGEYCNRVNKAYEYVVENNNYDIYNDRFINILKG